MKPSAVKACPACGTEFDLATIARNPEVVPIGMQFEDGGQHFNCFFFNHACARCGTTFVIPVTAFLPFITEPVPDLERAGTEDCEGHCLRLDDLATCHAACRYAPFRRFLLQMLAEHEAATGKTGA